MTDDGRIRPSGTQPRGPWDEGTPDAEPGAPGREPIFNAPWAATVLVGAILGAFAAQAWLGGDRMAAIGGFSAPGLAEGRWWTLISAIFLHGGLAHAAMNALGALAFGPPVARLLGEGAKGALAFFLFFLVCGAVASLGFAALHWRDPAVLVGASGAVSGLMGAASRIYGRRHGLAPVFSAVPMGWAVAWTIANVLLGITGISPGMPGAVIAWEAHLVGFAAGLVLIGPFARALEPDEIRSNRPDL
jgi:membrane associated rhomboid family serine protease